MVKIIVTGPNEAPKFSASLFSFTIPEDTANDYTVGSVTFIDEGKTWLYCRFSVNSMQLNFLFASCAIVYSVTL